jgi:hypothetical protein
MKALFLMAGLVFTAFLAPAQVSVSLTIDQQEFLPGEAVPVYVHIENHSGQTLHLGAQAGWLSFIVESHDGPVVVKKSDPPVVGPFDLGSSEVATKCVNLGPYFDLAHNGQYKVMATVHIPDWNVDVSSGELEFNVIDGAQLWSQDFGVPQTNGMPDVRKYTLIEANYLHDELRLYVQVSDESNGSVVQVQAIGPMISFGEPEAQLDPASDLHVLYQNGASTFTYAVIDPKGDIIQQDKYDYVSTRPRLHLGDDGSISVQGGVRRVSLPPVEPPAVLPR